MSNPLIGSFGPNQAISVGFGVSFNHTKTIVQPKPLIANRSISGDVKSRLVLCSS